MSERSERSEKSAVEIQADNVREWLKGSRIDGFTIECVDFKTVDENDRISYTIQVIVRNQSQQTVGGLTFKIRYPWLKLYPSYLKPEAQGRGLTCQMYMIPMAFAAEDERITMVNAKEVDSTLINKFHFSESGTLMIETPEERQALLNVMQRGYDACINVVKSFTSRRNRADVFAITDGSKDWSQVDPDVVTVGPSDATTAGPYHMQLSDPQLWSTVQKAKENWPTAVIDELKTFIPEDVWGPMISAVVDRVGGQGGDVLVHNKSDPMVGHHLETHGYTRTTKCENEVCHSVNHLCQNGQCTNEFYTYKLPSMTLPALLSADPLVDPFAKPDAKPDAKPYTQLPAQSPAKPYAQLPAQSPAKPSPTKPYSAKPYSAKPDGQFPTITFAKPSPRPSQYGRPPTPSV